MMYSISKEAREILENSPREVGVYMKLCLEKYFSTGKNPSFNSEELREFWLYLKIHELAYNIQRYDASISSWWGTFDHVELQSLLGKYSAKFQNRNFRIGKDDERYSQD